MSALLLILAAAFAHGKETIRAGDLVEERGMGFDVTPFDSNVDTASVKEVHIVFSNHLDVGFNSRSWSDGPSGKPYSGCISLNRTVDGDPCTPWSYAVINANMNTFIPRAAALEETLRGSDTPFSYMTQSFVTDFLEDCNDSGLVDWRKGRVGMPLLKCPNASAVAAFEAASRRGAVWWHAFPHNPMPGIYDASLFNASLRMGARLADQLGVRRPTTYSQRDETGITRAIVPLLAAAGVGMISLGSGGSSGGHPVVPDIFVWRDDASSSEVLFAHDHGYGGGTHVLPNGVALYCAWNHDNSGPLNADKVASVYAQLRKQYPNANVHQSTFNRFYDAFVALSAAEKAQMRVVTSEIGDTWLYGVPSDPIKNVRFRAMSRMRRVCVAEGRCDPEDKTMRRFDRLLTKIPEHTWGEDTTWYLGDNRNWTNSQTHPLMASAPNYRMTIDSWIDQRNFLDCAEGVLAQSGDAEYTRLARDIRAAVAAAAPLRPTPDGLREAGYVAVAGTPSEQAAKTFTCGGWKLRFGLDASLASLVAPSGAAIENREDNEGAFGRYTYQTLSADDFTAFDKDYGLPQCTPESVDPTCHNFNKPNMSSANPVHSETTPTLTQIWSLPSGKGGDSCAFWTRGTMPASLHTEYGAPDTVWVAFNVTAGPDSRAASLAVDVQLFNKTATRLAEASWVTFAPPVTQAESGWRLHAFQTGLTTTGADAGVDPLDVVAHGATHLHSLGPLARVKYTGGVGAPLGGGDAATISLESLDVPIVSAGLMSPFPTPGDNTTAAKDIASGWHFNLQNNIWNVNFPQWYPFVQEDADARFRFVVDVTTARFGKM